MDDTYRVAGSTGVTGKIDRLHFDPISEFTAAASTSRDYPLPLHSDRLISAKDNPPVERHAWAVYGPEEASLTSTSLVKGMM